MGSCQWAGNALLSDLGRIGVILGFLLIQQIFTVNFFSGVVQVNYWEIIGIRVN